MASSNGGSDGALSSSAVSVFAMPGILSSDPSGTSGPERAPLTTDDESDTSFEQPQQSMNLTTGPVGGYGKNVNMKQGSAAPVP